ncbi:5-hydroxytryptamine receptor 1E-like isoform X2 [Lytechinus variegatus]|uniref:5-hydroxytryptamine receptor 1E-like isoform X2 n=1 Tax=Lytechinus variegatus TaxID=7654 RepID=UPI001BB0FBDF|nr:5-hydroxytryptamine receptor 1E-like isoform X2 [Lytechinus variegatus]
MEEHNDFLPVSLFLSVLLVVGVTANTLALIVIRRFFGNSRSRRSSVPSVLVQALVIVDLFSTIVLVAENAISRWIFPGTALRCNVAYISRLSVAYASGFINASMCLERCLAFRAPFYYHDNATVFKAKVIVVIVIGLSVFLSILPLLGIGNYAAQTMVTPYNATIVVCTPPGELGSRSDLGNRVFTAIYAIVGACMLLIIYVCNTLVMLTLYALGRKATGLKRLGRSETAASSPSSRSFTLSVPKDNMRKQSIDGDTVVSTKDDNISAKMHPEKSREGIGREIRLAYVVGMLSVVFTISWLPFYVQRLLKAFDVEQPEWYLLLVIFLLVSNHVIDPFVFVFMKQQSRDALKDLCMKCICCRRCRPPPLSSRNTVNAHANGNQNRGASRNDSGINNSRNDSGIVVVVDSTLNPTEAPTGNPAPDDIHLDIANNRATHSAS